MITREVVVRMIETEFLSILMGEYGMKAEDAEAKLREARRNGLIDQHVGITMHSLGSGYKHQNAVC